MFMGTTPFITVRARRPLTEIEFCAWVAQAVPGDRLEYHRGFLTLDRCQGLSRFTTEERTRLTWLGPVDVYGFPNRLRSDSRLPNGR